MALLCLLPSVTGYSSQVTIATTAQMYQSELRQLRIKSILQIVLKITDLKVFIIFFGEVLHSHRCINTFVYMTRAIKNLQVHELRKKFQMDVA
jgi:hypothetical protein